VTADLVANFIDRALKFGEAAGRARDPGHRAQQRRFARHYVAAAVALSDPKPG
jgi:hypothetical protein